MLEFVNNHPDHETEFRKTLVGLYKLSQWASVEKYKDLIENKELVRHHLSGVVSEFSKAWREDKLPAINKLHIIESHLVDFIIRHGGWGIYGEQGNL